MKYSLLSLFICFSTFCFGQQNDSIIENYHSKKIFTKLGFSIGGVELFYGYNIFTNNELSKYIGRHRFSISININKVYWQKQKQLLKAIHQ